jgi:hypothetical protein
MRRLLALPSLPRKERVNYLYSPVNLRKLSAMFSVRNDMGEEWTLHDYPGSPV